jgi:TonB-like protein
MKYLMFFIVIQMFFVSCYNPTLRHVAWKFDAVRYLSKSYEKKMKKIDADFIEYVESLANVDSDKYSKDSIQMKKKYYTFYYDSLKTEDTKISYYKDRFLTIEKNSIEKLDLLRIPITQHLVSYVFYSKDRIIYHADLTNGRDYVTTHDSGDGRKKSDSMLKAKNYITFVEREPGVDLNELSANLVYPESMLQSDIMEYVLIRVLIDKKGKAIKIYYDSDNGKDFILAAIKALKRSNIMPAMQDGKPVACWLTIPFNFRLR